MCDAINPNHEGLSWDSAAATALDEARGTQVSQKVEQAQKEMVRFRVDHDPEHLAKAQAALVGANQEFYKSMSPESKEKGGKLYVVGEVLQSGGEIIPAQQGAEQDRALESLLHDATVAVRNRLDRTREQKASPEQGMQR